MSSENKNLANPYELLLVVAGSLKESEKKKELGKWEAEINKIGKILNKAIWENRNLAYKIKAETTGSYFIVHFETQSDQIAELENSLRLDPKVIRHLIYKTQKNYQWQEYSEEDLEHDFMKLNAEESQKESTLDNKNKKKPSKSKTSPKEKKSDTSAEKANVGEIDKKLDDILADL
jgi:ribosomal protein S6